MIAWKNMDSLASYEKLQNVKRVNLACAMSGESGAQRVKRYSVPMGRSGWCCTTCAGASWART